MLQNLPQNAALVGSAVLPQVNSSNNQIPTPLVEKEKEKEKEKDKDKEKEKEKGDASKIKPSEISTLSLTVNGETFSDKLFTKIHYRKKQFVFEWDVPTGGQETEKLKKKIEIKFPDLASVALSTDKSVLTLETKNIPKEYKELSLQSKKTWVEERNL
jgi:hypothetical protein